MLSYFSIEKQKISLLYRYYLLNDINKKRWIEKAGKASENEKEKLRFVWLLNCLKKEKYLIGQIENKLKEGWDFFRLLPLEKAVLIFASYEIYQKEIPFPLLIDQMVIFSKKYLEEDRYKYINKVLDLLAKSELKG